MADIRRIFTEIGVELQKLKKDQRQMFNDIANQVLDAYRVVLRDDFTTQGVIQASTYGFDIRDWDSMNPEMQDTLLALCARHPESVDKEKVSEVLSEGVVGYLREEGLVISDDQAQLFPDLMKGIMQGLEQEGVQFNNGVRKARILGLKPLVDYKNWLVEGGQTFMGYGRYSLELRMTDNAILANQNALTTALVSARDVEVDYGINRKRIEGITKAEISRRFIQDSPFVVIYETKGGKKGEIDVLRASVTSLTEERVKYRLHDLLFKNKINFEYGLENLGYEGSIEALIGLPQNVNQELRANVWRRHLKMAGVDFDESAEIVLVDQTELERVTFFYGTQYRGKDNGVMVAFSSDERYGDKSVLVYTRERMEEHITRAERARIGVADYNLLLEPMAVRDYVENGQRLTKYRT